MSEARRITSSFCLVFTLASSSFFLGLFSEVVLFLVLWLGSLRIGSVTNLVCAPVVYWNADRAGALCRPWLPSGFNMRIRISDYSCGQLELKDPLLVDILSLVRVGSCGKLSRNRLVQLAIPAGTIRLGMPSGMSYLGSDLGEIQELKARNRARDVNCLIGYAEVSIPIGNGHGAYYCQKLESLWAIPVEARI